ncbi:MAG: nucleotidyl transferase AbiEii/AbiGii toxin family protein [Lentisphaerae bacterium]|nr:nucleotidyl transferase AbiEii/AbiGii toxin family protein [Lentisphaerota bacterium]
MKQIHWEDVLSSLAESGIEFVIIGGAALSLHGISRTTLDIDIKISSKEGNIRELISALSGIGLTLDNEDFTLLINNPELLYGQCISFSIPEGLQVVDVFLERPGDFRSLLESSVKIRIGNADIHVASLENIRKMKIEIGRPIDLADVALIDEFLKLSP